MTASKFLMKDYSSLPEKGSITSQAPSNIALVKYWGKRDIQIPKNTSISFTLNTCKTITTLHFEKKEQITNDYSFQVYLDDERTQSFEPKIAKFFERIEDYLPFLKAYTFKIETTNSFPHSSGIASSASGMAALSMCLVALEKQINSSKEDTYYQNKTSFLARLGSGSASRSVNGPMMIWGKHNTITNSTNDYAIKHDKIHSIFKDYQDTILLLDKGEKQVSSTVGHQLMYGHPFSEQRFSQAQNHMVDLLQILESGNLKDFINLVEREALTLHAMMMTSNPYFILMKPNTLEIINKIWAFRKETNLNLCFTLDAGANVHLLYPKSEASKTLDFIKKELVAYCKNGEYLCDNIGSGASVNI
jgi:diphosphomevalonate decarboxylase